MQKRMHVVAAMLSIGTDKLQRDLVRLGLRHVAANTEDTSAAGWWSRGKRRAIASA